MSRPDSPLRGAWGGGYSCETAGGHSVVALAGRCRGASQFLSARRQRELRQCVGVTAVKPADHACPVLQDACSAMPSGPRCQVAVCNWLGALVRKVDVTSRKVNPDQSPGGIWFAGRCVIGLGLATRHYRETRYWAWYLLRIYVTVKPNGVDKKHCQMM